MEVSTYGRSDLGWGADVPSRNRLCDSLTQNAHGVAMREMQLLEVVFTIDELASVRRLVGQAAVRAALEPDRASDLVTAVNELVANSICHGGGEGLLRIWIEGDSLMCEVRDRGHMTEASIGRPRPAPDRLSGRGLWLVEELCDLTQISSSPDTGTSARIQMRLA